MKYWLLSLNDCTISRSGKPALTWHLEMTLYSSYNYYFIFLLSFPFLFFFLKGQIIIPIEISDVLTKHKLQWDSREIKKIFNTLSPPYLSIRSFTLIVSDYNSIRLNRGVFRPLRVKNEDGKYSRIIQLLIAVLRLTCYISSFMINVVLSI